MYSDHMNLNLGLKVQFTPESNMLFLWSEGVYILIAAGALMMVVGFLGCCGAIKESPCMLGLVSHSGSLSETSPLHHFFQDCGL